MSAPANDPAADRRRHLVWLVLAAAVPILGLALEVRGGTAVGLRGVSGFELPEVCTLRRGLNIPCPGCGLTRSVICLMRGDLAGSLAMHRLGWLVFGAILWQVPYRLLAMAGKAPASLERPVLVDAVWLTLLALVLLNWLFGALGVV